MANKKEVKSCMICCENFNKSNHKHAACQYCNYDTCTTCAETYLLGTTQDAHCMNDQCKKAWNQEFLSSVFTKKFVGGTYKKRREDLLFERERSMLPETQPYAESLKGMYELEKEEAPILKKIEAAKLAAHKIQGRYSLAKNMDERLPIHKEILESKVEIYRLKCEREYFNIKRMNMQRIINRTNAAGGAGAAEEAQERRQFVRACPSNDCKGFLSSGWKCGLCEVRVCSDCHEIKETKVEYDARHPKGASGAASAPAREHTCKQENVDTANLLKADSKNCPKCAAMIFKIEGCFAKDTPILMWDSTIKMSQDIRIGDVLIGDDGTPRIVEELVNNYDNLFEVTQLNGTKYTVNSKHKLVLKYSSDRKIYWKESINSWEVKWFDHALLSMKSMKSSNKEDLEKFVNSLKFPHELEITVDDYMKLNDSTKKHLMGYKANFIHWNQKILSVEPYLLGAWIGDGINNGVAFAANDLEVLEYLLNWCNQNNGELIHDSKFKFRIREISSNSARLAISHGATSLDCKGCFEKPHEICNTPTISYDLPKNQIKINPLKNQLEKYNLIKNKHIPKEFITNSKENRLQLLAGLIDTDGCLQNDNKRIIIVQTNTNIANSIELLAKSLGYNVHHTIRTRIAIKVPNSSIIKDYRDQHLINISGEMIHEIPTLIPRKKCLPSTPNKDGLRTSITVKPVGYGEYFGWKVDKNHRFLLPDLTVVRNCDQMYCTQCQTAFSWRTGRIETGTIHNPHYYEYLRRQNGGVAPRNVGDFPCGGMPTAYDLRKCAEKVKGSREIIDLIMIIHRMHAHIQYTELPRYTTNAVADNRDLRAAYLIQKIDEEKFKHTLQKNEKARNKKNDIRMVVDMFLGTTADIMRNIVQSENLGQILERVDELNNLRTYFNDSMKPISQRYGCVAPNLNDKWLFLTFKY